MGCLTGIVRVATGVLLIIIAAGLASCHPAFFSFGNDLLRLTPPADPLTIFLGGKSA